jgi:hypothetical protein
MIQKLKRCIVDVLYLLSFIFHMVFFFYLSIFQLLFIYHPSIDGMLRVLVLKPNQPSDD